MMPEQAKILAEADTPYMLWIELWILFEEAYREPQNRSLIECIYKYAEWCVHQPKGSTAADDLGTCVSVCFYEHIPTCKAAWEDVPSYFTKEDFTVMSDIFKYFFTEEEFNIIEKTLEGRTFRT